MILLERLRNRLMIGERQNAVADDLPGFVAFSSHDERIARFKSRDGVGDRRAPVSDLDDVRRAAAGSFENFCANGGGVLAARIVVRDDGDIRRAGDDVPHQRALATITIAAAPEDDNQAFFCQRP